MPLGTSHFRTACVTLTACLTVCAAVWAEAPVYDAISNHDFSMNKAGWGNWPTKGAFEEIQLTIATTQMGDLIVKELVARMDNMPEAAVVEGYRLGFEVYSNFVLHPEPGHTYTMLLTAKGKGFVRLGAIEYGHGGGNARKIFHNVSEAHALTGEYRTYEFAYTASPGITGMRPTFGFYLPADVKACDVDARIKSFSMPVSEAEYSVICREQLKDGLWSYRGFSEKELAEIRHTAVVDTVLPPYEPIRATGDRRLRLTTAEVAFGSNGLPEDLDVLGRDVLAGGIVLEIVYGDGTKVHLHPGDAATEVSEQRVILNQPFRSNGRSATLVCELNYDGFVVYTLAVERAPGEHLTNVSLTIPYAPETARYIRYSGRTGKRFGSQLTDGFFGFGPIPDRGERVRTTVNTLKQVWNDWRPFIAGGKGDFLIWEHQDPDMPTIWIGDDRRGLALLCWTNQGHHHQRAKEPTVRLLRTDDAVNLTYNFINGEASLEQDRTIRFALAVTPPKPVREDWFGLRFGRLWSLGDPWSKGHYAGLPAAFEALKHRHAAGGPTPARPPYSYPITYYNRTTEADLLGTKPWDGASGRRYRDYGLLWFGAWSIGCSSPIVTYPEVLKTMIGYSKRIGHCALPYFAATHLAAADKNCFFYAVKKEEWLRTDAPKGAFVGVCPNSLSSEYIAHGIGKMIDDYGIEGVYFDNSFLVQCANSRHGCGFRGDDGEWHKTWSLLGMRKLFMMVRHEFARRGKEPFIYAHTDAMPGVASFLDAYLYGEGIYGSDFTEMVSLGEWRAHYLGPNQTGAVHIWCGNFHTSNYYERERRGMDYAGNVRFGTRTFLTMAVLHGTKLQSGICDVPFLKRLWRVYDELQGEVEFIPYWHWPTANEAINPRDVYATAYSQGGRLLLAVSNLSRIEQEVQIPLAAIRETNGAVARASDHLHKRPVVLENGNIIFAIPAKDFRLITLE